MNGTVPEWITTEDVVFFHGQIIDAFGGSQGVRDLGRLQAALGRPNNVFAYESQDLCVLAGAYAHGIAKNPPFIDGNKRSAFMVARVFLGLNGLTFDPPEPEAAVKVEALASGALTEQQFASWLLEHSKPPKI